ncbi:MAG TPA: glycosyltransferase family 2 protein [Holophagaceae bacterium]|jgi:putative glycosyltransferase|nr:glycosyltransferase family 2 protein [Holophagaceae bacterium]
MKHSISVVTTLYRSSGFIEEFYRRVKETLSVPGYEFEIIFVNDGSPDDSLLTARHLAEADPSVTVVDLSRNFGHHKAMMTGLAFARMDLVFLIDVDLEEAPELVWKYLEEMRQDSQLDVVYGVQDKRKGSPFERLSGAVFYRLFNWLCEERIPRNMSLSRLMTRRYVRSLLRYRERNLFIPGVWHIMGYAQKGVPITKTSRGESTYTLRKKIAHFVNAVTSFSDTPLILIFYTGVGICTASFAMAFYFILKKLIYGVSSSGWTSLIVTFSGLAGIIILFLGVIGIYLSKMFIELKQRPHTIVREVFRQNDQAHPAGGVDGLARLSQTYKSKLRRACGSGE